MPNYFYILLGALVLWLVYYIVSKKMKEMKQEAEIKTQMKSLKTIPLDIQSEIALTSAAVDLEKKDTALAKANQTSDPVQRAKLIKEAKKADKSAKQSAKVAVKKIKQLDAKKMIKKKKNDVTKENFGAVTKTTALAAKGKAFVAKKEVKLAMNIAKGIMNPVAKLLDLVLGSKKIKRFICKLFKVKGGNTILNNQDIVLSFVKCITSPYSCPFTLIKLGIKIGKKIGKYKALKKFSKIMKNRALEAEIKAKAAVGTPDEQKLLTLALKARKNSDLLVEKVKVSCLTCGPYKCQVIKAKVVYEKAAKAKSNVTKHALYLQKVLGTAKEAKAKLRMTKLETSALNWEKEASAQRIATQGMTSK